jgi:HD-GYP domain-containing protein (c-di-GMP phosphodiesterase class II)
MIAAQYTLVSLKKLRTGVALGCPLYDGCSDPPILLLAQGTVLTESLQELLEKRGVTDVRVNKADLGKLVRYDNEALRGSGVFGNKLASLPKIPATVKSDFKKAKETARNRPDDLPKLTPNSFAHNLQDISGREIQAHEVRVAKTRRNIAAEKIDCLFEQLETKDIRGTQVVTAVTAESLLQIVQDLDLFLALGINTKERKYPSRHSLQMAMLSMAIGTVHGLSRNELIELGIGCLIHDVGMLFLKDQTFQTSQEFGAKESLEITKHPMLTINLLQQAKDIPKPSLMVAHQIHERCNGEGYPRNRTANQIHPLAKIAAVADVYVAMISFRKHRPGILPYHAIEQILFQTKNGLFDKNVVRSFLYTISVFPVGSTVLLNTGDPARVIRTNRTDFMRPVVEVWNIESPESPPKMVNLMDTDEYSIVTPLAEFPFITPEFASL